VSLFRVFQNLKGNVVGSASGATTKAASGTIVTSLVDDVSEFLSGLATPPGELSNQVVMMTNPNSVAVAALPSCRGWNGLA
jgi:large-conductance mechanosensitive channel